MAQRPSLRPLSVFLLKETIGSYEASLRDADVVQWHEIAKSTGVTGAVAVRPPQGRTPWWAAYLRPHLARGDPLGALVNASTSAILFLSSADRRFAVTFGFGRHLLDPETYEHDFGLKVVLNTVEPEQLRSVDARTFDELTIHTRRDLSRGSSFGTFGLDVTRDIVRAVTGPPRDETLAQRATGSDSLGLITRVQFGDLPDLCRRLLDAYGSNDYKEHFAFIDHLRAVRDPALTAVLDQTLADALRADELTDIHLAPPEPMNWANLAGFTFSTRDNRENLDADPRITAYLETVDTAEITVNRLKHDHVLAIGSEGDQVIETWSVYRCLVFESREGRLLYALTAGQWYGVSASFAEEIERFATELPQLDVELPDAAEGVKELAYNKAAALAIGALCLDQKLVQTPGGDRIEVCDLLTENRQFIHVKKRGSSSNLSHLFSQGLVSAEMLTREAGFRDHARVMVAGLDQRFAETIPAERPSPGTCEVSYAVITRSRRDTPLTLPFFSLVNLRTATLRLQDLGYRVTVCQVNEAR